MATSLPHSTAAAWSRSIRTAEPPRLPAEAFEEGEEAPEEAAALLGRWGMAPPAWLLLEGSDSSFPALSERLRPPFLLARTRTLAALRALEEASRALAAEGIDLLVTQGAALIGSVPLPHPEFRHMVDTDVMVRPHEADRAREALRGRGFEALDGVGRYVLESGVLDLHVRPLGMERIRHRRLALPLDAGEVWEGAGPAPPSGPLPAACYIPSLPWQWVMVLAHAQKHSFSSLTWFLDLLLLGEALGPSERRSACEHARRLGLEGAWSLMGEVLEGWGSPLPPGLVPAGERLPADQARLVRRGVARVRALEDPGWIGERMLWRMAPGPWERLLLVWETLFPGRATMRTLYPSYRPLLRPFYMLRRLWELGTRLLPWT